MLDRIKKFLTGIGTEPVKTANNSLQIAVAALLAEAARMDDQFDASERAVIKGLLMGRFHLSAEAAESLVVSGEEVADQSSQLFRFTHTIAQHLQPAERIGIIETLWEVVYADGTLSPDEDALLRRVAGLLHVPDRDRGQARQRVLQRLGYAPSLL